MKKLITILTITMFLSSCYFKTNPDKRSIFVIYNKKLFNESQMGKYKYTINITYSDNDQIYLYSDSNWNVGDTVKLTK